MGPVAIDNQMRDSFLVGVVGPCGAGKSTLIQGLEGRGYRCRHIAQEHSYVPYMWRRMTNPDILIYLHASFAACTARRNLNWLEADYSEQLRRLEHARQHADITLETDDRSPAQVLEHVVSFLAGQANARAG